jgi:hypothetical protein
MPFIGNQPALSFTSFAKQDFSTSATTSYTLDNPVANANELALFINFVRQEPTTAYSASGTTLTLTSATASSDDMYCVYLGKAVQTVNPPNSSVGLSQLTASGTKDATTFLRGDNTFAVAGGTNTPSFSAERSGDQTISNSTRTTILFNNEFYDSSSAYDTSTGKFTPQVAGKYFVNANVQLNTNSNSNLSYAFIEMYKNSSIITEDVEDTRTNYGRKTTCDATAIVDMNGSSDFILIQGFIAEVSGSGSATVRDMSTFQAFKIIE